MVSNYEGKLAIHALQFHEVCGGDGPKWAAEHHTCLLLTIRWNGWIVPHSSSWWETLGSHEGERLGAVLGRLIG